MEKDSELSTVKSEREKLEKEMQAMLQQEKDVIKSKGKGPGGMLHSALQQLQRELRREAVANEKLMVKAESLLKDGSKPVSSTADSTPAEPVVATADEEEEAPDRDEKAKDDEEQEDEEVSNEQAVDEPVRCVACPSGSALPCCSDSMAAPCNLSQGSCEQVVTCNADPDERLGLFAFDEHI